jgi:hypothetical protein
LDHLREAPGAISNNSLLVEATPALTICGICFWMN